MRRLLALVAAVLLPGAICSAADPPPERTLEMKLVQVGQAPSYSGTTLRDGKGEIEFPNRPGKLKLQYKSGRLTVDSNGNGKIDSQDRSITPRSNPSDSVMVSAVVGDRDTELQVFVIDVNSMSKDSQMVMIGYGGAMEGTLDGTRVRAEFSRVRGDSSPQFSELQVIPAGQTLATAPRMRWPRIVAIGSAIYQPTVLDRGWKLQLAPYTGPVALVKLKIAGPATNCEATFVGAEDAQGQTTAKDFVAFIPGKYRLGNAHLNIRKGANDHVCVSGQSQKDGKPFEFKTGENVIALGAPFRMDFAASRLGNTIEFTDASVLGASGERYGAAASNAVDGQMLKAFIRSGGQERELAKLEYG
jgi:hypothetical protein